MFESDGLRFGIQKCAQGVKNLFSSHGNGDGDGNGDDDDDDVAGEMKRIDGHNGAVTDIVEVNNLVKVGTSPSWWCW